jgi:hypothetical protein
MFIFFKWNLSGCNVAQAEMTLFRAAPPRHGVLAPRMGKLLCGKSSSVDNYRAKLHPYGIQL